MRTYLRATCLVLTLGILTALCVGLGFVWASGYVWPAQTPKTLLFLGAATTSVGIGWGYLLTLKVSPTLRLTSVDLVLGAVVVFVGINRYLIQDIQGFSPRFYELGGLAVIYITVRACRPRLQRWILAAVAAGGLGQAVYGSLQLYGFYPSLHSTFGVTGGFFNPGPYAGYLATTFAVAGGLYFSATSAGNSGGWNRLSRPLLRGLSVTTMTVIVLVLPTTGSRAGLAGLVLGGGYLLTQCYDLRALINRYLPTPARRILAAALVTVILGAGMVGSYLAKKGSADGRVLIWGVTVQMIGARPMAGLGIGGFDRAYMDDQACWFRRHPGGRLASQAGSTQYAFSAPLQWVAEQGLLGMALAVILVLMVVRADTGNRSHPYLWAASGGLIALAGFGLFSYPTHIVPIMLAGTVCLAGCGTAAPHVWSLGLPVGWIPKITGTAMIATIIAASGLGIFKWNHSARTWKQALIAYHQKDYERSLSDYRMAAPALTANGTFLGNYGKALSMAHRDSAAIDMLRRAARYHNNSIVQTAMGGSYRRLGQYHSAEVAFQKAAHMQPSHFYPFFLLAKLYEATDRPEEAVAIARKLTHKIPKVPSQAVRQIKQKMEALIQRNSSP